MVDVNTPSTDPSGIEAARLADYTTFQLGGPCRRLFACETPAALQSTVQRLVAVATPYTLIGGGSNLLVADEGIDTVVVRYFTDEPMMVFHGECVEVSGSTLLDHLVRAAVERGLDGVTHCSGIPGTVGGAIAGNAGAFGRQLGDQLEHVDVIDPRGGVVRVRAEEAGFAYRSSRFQESGEIILSARLRLRTAGQAAVRAERESILGLRRDKHPDWRREPCIGSIFRNIEPSSAAERRQAAGWFLEKAGAKNLRVGGAYVYPKHANIIIKGEDGTAADVLALIQQMREAVRKRFQFELQPEVRWLGNV